MFLFSVWSPLDNSIQGKTINICVHWKPRGWYAAQNNAMVFLTADSNVNFWVSKWKITRVCAWLNSHPKKCRTLHILFSLNVAIISVFSAEEECMVINVIGQQLKEWIERRFLPLIFQSRPDDSVNNNAFSVIYCPLQQLGCQIQGDWIMDRHWRLNVGKMCPCAAAEPRSNSLAGVTVP